MLRCMLRVSTRPAPFSRTLHHTGFPPLRPNGVRPATGMSRNSSSSNGTGVVAQTKSLDHLVLTVKDIDATIRFYEQVLGMRHTCFASAGSPDVQRHALSFGEQKINLHVSGHEFEPKAQRVMPGSGDLCFLVEDDVQLVLSRLKEKGIDVLEGGCVVPRTGAQGKLRSVYLRDPDGNLIELSNMDT